MDIHVNINIKIQVINRLHKRGKPKDRHHLKQVKHLVQNKIRLVYNNYLQNILCLSEEGNANAENN